MAGGSATASAALRKGLFLQHGQSAMPRKLNPAFHSIDPCPAFQPVPPTKRSFSVGCARYTCVSNGPW